MQVLQWRQKMGLPDDDVLVYLDAWGLRRLFALALRRRSSNRRQKDAVTECLFETLVQAWGHVKHKKGAKGKTGEEVEAEEKADVEDVFQEEENDCMEVQFKPAETDEYQLVTSPACKTKPGCEDAHEPSRTEADEGSPAKDLDGEIFEMDLEEQMLVEEIALLRLQVLQVHILAYLFCLVFPATPIMLDLCRVSFSQGCRFARLTSVRAPTTWRRRSCCRQVHLSFRLQLLKSSLQTPRSRSLSFRMRSLRSLWSCGVQ